MGDSLHSKGERMLGVSLNTEKRSSAALVLGCTLPVVAGVFVMVQAISLASAAQAFTIQRLGRAYYESRTGGHYFSFPPRDLLIAATGAIVLASVCAAWSITRAKVRSALACACLTLLVSFGLLVTLAASGQQVDACLASDPCPLDLRSPQNNIVDASILLFTGIGMALVATADTVNLARRTISSGSILYEQEGF